MMSSDLLVLNDIANCETHSIAVLIPCYNEELTIGDVVRRFREQLPDAKIYVFDNNSIDRTVEEAQAAGALIRYEKRQGKGYVVQSMFGQIDADVYVIVDGDGTYPPQAVHGILEPVHAGEADMVVGSRLHSQSHRQFRSLNLLGNSLFLSFLNSTFKVKSIGHFRRYTRGDLLPEMRDFLSSVLSI